MNKKSGGGSAAPNAYKALSILLALVLLAAAVVELVLWRLDYIVFQNPNAGQAQEEADLNDNLVMTPQNGKLMRLSVTSAAAADGGYEPVTLTATVLPETATDKTVDWAVAFVNPSSEWASGKTATDYVTVTPSSDGAATATVQCLEDFGAQIVVTATSRDNPEATAQCTVDFAQKLVSTSVSFAFSTSIPGDFFVGLKEGSWAILKILLETSSGKATYISHNTTKVYTLADKFSTTVTIAPSAELLAKAKEINPAATSGSYDATIGITPNRDFFAQLLGEEFANANDLYKLGELLDAKGVEEPFIVTVTTKSTNGYAEDKIDTYYLAYTASDVREAVTEISFEEDEIIF